MIYSYHITLIITFMVHNVTMNVVVCNREGVKGALLPSNYYNASI